VFLRLWFKESSTHRQLGSFPSIHSHLLEAPRCAVPCKGLRIENNSQDFPCRESGSLPHGHCLWYKNTNIAGWVWDKVHHSIHWCRPGQIFAGQCRRKIVALLHQWSESGTPRHQGRPYSTLNSFTEVTLWLMLLPSLVPA